MPSSEKTFWFLFGSYLLGVSWGIGSQLAGMDARYDLPMLPICIALVTFLFLSRNRLEVVADLARALLIWLYFPLAVAFGLLDAAMGVNEGILRFDHFNTEIYSLTVFGSGIGLLLGAVVLTVSYLRRMATDRSASVKAFCVKSLILQLVLAPLLLMAQHLAG